MAAVCLIFGFECNGYGLGMLIYSATWLIKKKGANQTEGQICLVGLCAVFC